MTLEIEQVIMMAETGCQVNDDRGQHGRLRGYERGD